MRVGSAGNDERGNQSEGEVMNLLKCSAEEILYLLDLGRITPEQLLEQIGFAWPMREGDEFSEDGSRNAQNQTAESARVLFRSSG
jgi:hypothetical protein